MGIEEGRGEEGMEVQVNLEMDEEKPRDDAFAMTRRHAQLSTAVGLEWLCQGQEAEIESRYWMKQGRCGSVYL